MLLTRLPRPPSPYLPIYAALGVTAGVWLGERALTGGAWFTCAAAALSPPPAWLLLGLLPLAGLGWWGRRQRRIAIPLLLLAAGLLGFWRYLDHPFEPCQGPADLRNYHAADEYGRARVLEGVIVGYPDRRQTFAQYRVRVEGLWQGERRIPVAGVALVRAGPEAVFAYGDRVRIRGAPAAPPVFPGFDYRRFLARKGIHTLIRRAEMTLIEPDQGSPFWATLYAFRARGAAILNQTLPRPYSDLANGMILGIETGIDRDLYEQFNLTGASHVIVISGSNIAIVSGILLGMFTRLLRRRRLVTAITLAGILFYTLLVGADAAVTRAALMGSLYVIAVGLGRQSAAIVSLFFAGLIMLLLNPLTLWDVGFQLSFMATLGLILFNAPLRRRWDARIGQRLPAAANALLAEGLLVTFAAQITTLPLVVYYFGRLSLISFLVNLLIIPVQPLIMIAGGLALFSGLIWLPLAKVIALLPLASLWWTVFIVQKGAALPFASLEISAFGRLIAALYTVAFALGFLWWLLRQEQAATALLPPALRPGLTRAALAAGLLILPLWGAAAWAEAQPDGRLHLYLLGREQGAAFLIITPGGNRILLDPAHLAPAYPLPGILASLPGGQRPLDLLIQTRAAPADAPVPAASQRLLPADLSPGALLTLDAGVTLTLLHAPAAGEDSLLFRLQFGDFSTLLPFENSQATQQALIAQASPALTLLIAPYPGTGAWPHPDLLAHLRPQLLLQPAGTTYPPAVQAALTHSPALAAIPNNALVAIHSDSAGRTFTLSARPYAADVVQR